MVINFAVKISLLTILYYPYATQSKINNCLSISDLNEVVLNLDTDLEGSILEWLDNSTRIQDTCVLFLNCAILSLYSFGQVT